MLDLFLLLLLAHFAGDFVFQDEKMARGKNGGGKNPEETKSLLIHAGIHFVLYLSVSVIMIFVLHYSNIKWLFSISTLLAISHLIIDWKKPYWECIGINNKALVFILDQTIHIALIILVINYLSRMSIITLLQSYESTNAFETFVLIFIGIIFITDVSNIFIRLFLSTIKGSVNEEAANSAKTGRYIGNLERILTFLAVIAGIYEVLLGIYGTKTAMRFNEFNKKDFAEYYFIGTLLSAALATFAAMIYLWLMG